MIVKGQNSFCLWRCCIVLKSELTTESVIINRLGKGENKVNFILILPPSPPLHPPDYIDKYRCYCALCFSHFKEMLDSPACRYNTCSIVVNITPTDSGSHDINWPEDSYFSSFIPRTCITGSVPPVKLVTYHVNVTNYNDQLHFFDG